MEPTDEVGELGHALDVMAAELHARNLERDRLLTAVVQATEDERRRIAGDVHDDSIQVMSAHVMGLQLLRRHTSDEKLAQRISELEESGRAAIARLRDLVFDLHSPVLEERGLGYTLEVLCQRTFEGEAVEWDVSDLLPGPPHVAIRDTAYRIAQEAIANARRHANATRACRSISRASTASSWYRSPTTGRDSAAT